ncbi:MAG: aspartate aminotransferase family protein [Caldicoprobacterales bacterium]|nr:aminotransferase class III-fold pyridoxal phosphate-dependent enzyme [Clostridiales bacterium]
MAKTLEAQFELAKKSMPGGVNSSTRLNRAIGLPFYAAEGKGSHVKSIEGKDYIDMCCAHGAGLLGQAHPAIDEALQKATSMGYLNSFETEYHEELAAKVCNAIPCADKVRFCSSGSEATLHLIRACRAYTGKKKIMRVEGHFHGYHELIYIGGQPPKDKFPDNRVRPYIESPGIPDEFADLIIPIPFNDPFALEQAIIEHGHETAALIMEPVNYNTGGIKPKSGYLELVRSLTAEAGIVLFFDEIQSSFKKSLGGAQKDFGVVPDVCTIGKSLGGGLPLSAFCGKSEIMDLYQPVGTVQHSGTFNAHLVPILAGLAFLNEAEKPYFYPRLQELENQFHDGINRIIEEHDLNMVVPHHGARFNILLGRRTEAARYEETFCHNRETMFKFIKGCFDRGVYFHDYGGGPSHHGYSIQHTAEDIDNVLQVMEEVLADLREEINR